MTLPILQSPDDVKVWKLFKYAQSSFGRAGINIAFPKDTDPKKTYKWRYLFKFAQKLDELQITNEVACRLIDAVATYAVRSKQLHKGLALLVSDSVLETCCKDIERCDKSRDTIIDRICKDAKFVRVNDPMARSSEHGLPNIVKWHMRGLVSELYISLSEKCENAIIKLDKVERSMLPSTKELALTAAATMKDVRIKHKIRSIMGDDLRGIFG